MTTVYTAPRRFTHDTLARCLNSMGLPKAGGPSDDPTIDLSEVDFCDPSATVCLAAYGAHHKRLTGRNISLNGWKADSYFSRVGMKKFLGYQDDYPYERRDEDRLTSIIEIVTDSDRSQNIRYVLEVLGIQHSGADMLLGYCLEEILRNVEDHADSAVNALLQAQYYPRSAEVVLGIADTGFGILHNMRQRHDLEDDEQALRAALKPGVSGRNTRKGTNAGLGLTASSRMITRMGGSLGITSGTCHLVVTKSGIFAQDLVEGWKGVIVTMCLPRDDGLDWEGAFKQVMNEL